MYESYGTYVNDEYVENHDYDDDTDDDNDHKKDNYTAGVAAPTQTRPDRALDRRSEALDRFIMKIFCEFYRSEWVPGSIYSFKRWFISNIMEISILTKKMFFDPGEHQGYLGSTQGYLGVKNRFKEKQL